MQTLMTKSPLLLTGILLLSACGSESGGKKTPAGPDASAAKLLNIQGKSDPELLGVWISPCLTNGQESRRLTYRFTKESLSVVESIDLLRDGCEKPSFDITYRFELKDAIWKANAIHTRSAPAKLVQVIAKPYADQFTKRLNESFQCGRGDWATGRDLDITDLQCFGIGDRHEWEFPLTSPASFTLNSRIMNNKLRLTVDNQEVPFARNLAKIFAAEQELDQENFQDIGLKFWGNELPLGPTIELTQTIQVNDLPNFEGQGNFSIKGIKLDSTRALTSLKDGLLTLTLKVPESFSQAKIEVNYFSIYSDKTKTFIYAGYDEAKGVYELRSSTSAGPVIGTVQSVPIRFTLPEARSIIDTKAPEISLGSLKFEKINETYNGFKVLAKDDIAGFDGLVLEFEKQDMTGQTIQTSITLSQVTYLGSSYYLLKVWSKLEGYGKLVGVRAFDRAGNISEQQKLETPLTF